MNTFAITATRILLCLSCIFITSCRLVITTDESGSIISASGLYDCDQAECVFEIEEKVTETFSAVPAEGHRFIRWQGFCSTTPVAVCDATIIPLSEEHSEFDGDSLLSAVFEPTNKMRAWFLDKDGDHFGTPTQRVAARQRPEGYVVNRDDCDDNDPSVRPWTKELDDGRDNNCNGKIDEGFVDTTFYQDGDEDGFGNPEVSRVERQRPAGYVRNKLDCDDGDPAINPEAQEITDDRDNDCDGNIDEGGNRYFRDVDGDGFGVSANAIVSMEPVDGYVLRENDCDDNNASISPEAAEQFDSVDNDCDGLVDEGFTTRNYYRDLDEDGFGDRNDVVQDIEAPDGYVANGSDNCVEMYNPSQSDIDRDGKGDACDNFTDSDDDGVQDSADNCPEHYNRHQDDMDADGLGDACDPRNDLDLDNDGINAEQDNCPIDYNPSQSDEDEDGRGDACDAVDDSVADEPNGHCSISSEDQAMLEAVNVFRGEARQCGSQLFQAVSPMSWNCELKTAALNHSRDMANKNFFGHQGSDGSSAGDRMSAAGYVWSAWGENVAAGYYSVSSVMQGWIGSPGHCANLMNPNFTNLGAAKFSNPDSNYNVYWTQVFGRPR